MCTCMRLSQRSTSRESQLLTLTTALAVALTLAFTLILTVAFAFTPTFTFSPRSPPPSLSPSTLTANRLPNFNQVEGLGHFRKYANGRLIGRFADRTVATLLPPALATAGAVTPATGAVAGGGEAGGAGGERGWYSFSWYLCHLVFPDGRTTQVRSDCPVGAEPHASRFQMPSRTPSMTTTLTPRRPCPASGSGPVNFRRAAQTPKHSRCHAARRPPRRSLERKPSRFHPPGTSIRCSLSTAGQGARRGSGSSSLRSTPPTKLTRPSFHPSFLP